MIHIELLPACPRLDLDVEFAFTWTSTSTISHKSRGRLAIPRHPANRTPRQGLLLKPCSPKACLHSTTTALRGGDQSTTKSSSFEAEASSLSGSTSPPRTATCGSVPHSRCSAGRFPEYFFGCGSPPDPDSQALLLQGFPIWTSPPLREPPTTRAETTAWMWPNA